MAERPIEEGFVDCPKFGIMDEQRCLPSCGFHQTKDQARIVCRFGEPRPAANPSGAATADAADAVSQSEEPAPTGRT